MGDSGTKDNGKEGRFKNFCESNLGSLLISIVVGFTVTAAIEWLHVKSLRNIDIYNVLLNICLTYIIMGIIREPYGKLQSIVTDYTKREEELRNVLDRIGKSNSKLNNYVQGLQGISDKNQIRQEEVAGDIIPRLLRYLSETAYGDCANEMHNCYECSKYMKSCKGLLREYLKEDCQQLSKLIQDVSTEYKYELNNNIPYYHTLAIERMIKLQGKCYRVIQPLLERKEQIFDKMDIDFTHIFLQRLQEGDYAKKQDFKVKWLFVGNHSEDKAKNNYSYLIEELLRNENKEIRAVFEFKTINKLEYKQKRDSFINIGNTHIDQYFLANPSLGIFDKAFVFVDAVDDEDESKHGTMYANQKDILNLIVFYDKLWEDSDAKPMSLENLVDFLKK